MNRDMKFSGNKLRNIRLSKGISQLQMANDCGLNQSLVSKYERGDVLKPPHDAIEIMASYLGVDADEFYDADFEYKEAKSDGKTQRLDVHVYFHIAGVTL
jgi:transcriptional regulator with XRE-family HTH domain